MSTTSKHCLLIAIVSVFVFFANLGGTRLWDDDETIYASCAREMLARGDWVVPYYNGQVFFDKPPLVYWSIMAGFGLLGQNELAARFFSALLGVATCLLTYLFGRRLFGASAGLWAGLITASTIVFTVSARAATIDMALTFLTTAAMYMFAIIALPKANSHAYLAASESAGSAAAARHPVLDWLLWAAIYGALAVAVLAKGPVGLLLPWCTMGLFLLLYRYSAQADLRQVASPHAAGTLQSSCGAGAVDATAAQRAYRRLPMRQRIVSASKRISKLLWNMFSPWNVLAVIIQMRSITAAVMLALVALPWYALVTHRTDGLWLEQFISKYNIAPFLQPSLGHRGPFFYHFVMILVGFFPWSVFLGPAVVFTYRQLRCPGGNRWPYVLLSCWIAVFFLFWSACSTKLPHYVLPTYPALAMLTGSLLADWLATVRSSGGYRLLQAACAGGAKVPASGFHPAAQPGRSGSAVPIGGDDFVWHPLSAKALRRAVASFVLVGVGMMIGVPIAASQFTPGEEAVGLVGLILVLGAAAMCWYIRRAQAERMLAACAATSVLLLVGIFGWAAVRIDAHQHAAPLAAAAREDCQGEPQLVGYRYLQPSVVYYAGRPVPCADNTEQLRQALAAAERPYIITTQAHAEQLQAEVPGLQVVAAQPRFLKRHQVVLVLRASDRFLPAETAGRMGAAQR